MPQINERFSYDDGDSLGHGTYGRVYGGRDTQASVHPRNVAIKFLKEQESTKAQSYAAERFEAEIRLLKMLTKLSGLESAHVRHLADGTTVDGKRYLVMEQCSGISVDEFVREGIDSNPKVRVHVICQIFQTVVRTLRSMHKFGIVHRDIKPEHILIHQCGRTGTRTCRLIDFGMAKDGNDPAQNLTVTGGNIGSEGFQAPEARNVRFGDFLTQFADVYSIAAVILVCLSGKSIDEVKATRGKRWWTKVPRNDFSHNLDGIPHNIVSVLNRCLEETPYRRLSSAELLQFLDEFVTAKNQSLTRIRPRSLPYLRHLKSLKQENGVLLGGGAMLAVAVLLGLYQSWTSVEKEERITRAMFEIIERDYLDSLRQVDENERITSDDRKKRRQEIEEEYEKNLQYVQEIQSLSPASRTTSQQHFLDLLISSEADALSFAESTRPSRFAEARNHPQDAQVLLAIDLQSVRLLTLQQRNHEAAELLCEIINVCPDWLEALEYSGKIALKVFDRQNSAGSLEEAINIGEWSAQHAAMLVKIRPNPTSRRLQAELWSEGSPLLIKRGREGDLQSAIDAETKSLLRRRELKSEHDAPPDIDRDLSVSLERLAEYFQDRGFGVDLAAAFQYYDECLRIRRARHEREPRSPEARRDLQVILSKLAIAKQRRSIGIDQDEALANLTEGLTLTETNLRENPDSPETLRDLSVVCRQLGDFHSQRRSHGDLTHALSYYERGLEAARELQRRRPSSELVQHDIAYSLRKLGDFYFDRNEVNDAKHAEETYRDSLKITKTLYDSAPTLYENAEDHAASLERLGDFLGDRAEGGDSIEAVGHLRQCLALHETFVANANRSTKSLTNLSAVLESTCMILSRTGDPNDLSRAIQIAEQDLKISQELLEGDPNSWFRSLNVSISMERLGSILAKSKTPESIARTHEILISGLKVLEKWRPSQENRSIEFEEAFSANAEPLAIHLARYGNTEDSRQSRELWTQILESRSWMVGQEGNDGRFGEGLANAHYNAACSFAIIGAKPNEDSNSWTLLAIAELKTALGGGFSRYDLMRSDPDLNILRNLPDFCQILDDLPQ